MASKLILVGGGRMGEALIGGLIASGWARASEVAVIEPLAARRQELADRFDGLTVLSDHDGRAADGAVLATKPAQIAQVAAALSGSVPRVLSIAAGITTAAIESAAPGVAVVRSMPNTPALVGAGASAIAAGSLAGPDDLEWAAAILGAVGTVVTVPEYLLDAVTGLSGSGPAYLFMVAEALIEGGVLNGLPRDVSAALTRQLFVGAARLLDTSGDTPEVLRAAVTSPGGTTAAGLRALEDHGLRAAMLSAVTSATERAHQLGS